MKFFVVSRNDQTLDFTQLTNKLSEINIDSDSKNTIIAIDSLYNLPLRELPHNDPPKNFHINDFLHKKGIITDGRVTVDTNCVSSTFSMTNAKWIVVDFGLHDLSTGIDFIKKVSIHFFINPQKIDLNLVLLVPAVHLPIYLRAANSAFNALPENSTCTADSIQTEMLFISAISEKIISQFPLLTWPLVKAKKVSLFIIRRLLKKIE